MLRHSTLSTMKSLFLAFLSSLLSWLILAIAAEGTPPSPSSHVRVTVPCRFITASSTGHCTLSGRLARWESDSLAVATSDRTIPFAFQDLDRLEVSQGRKSYKFLGAGLGALIGAGVSYLILNSGGSTAPCNRSENQDAMNSGECLGLYALGGLAGAGIGFVIGGAIHSESWQDVPLQK